MLELVRPGYSVYDIGAFIGVFALAAARRVGTTGYVAAFEPDPAAASAMRTSAAANAFAWMSVENSAVSDHTGRVAIGKIDDGHLSLAIDRDEATQHFEIDCISIDEFVLAGHRPPDVVKIDVEGAEEAVLRGMRGTLEKHAPHIICEIHGTMAEVCAFLEPLGYATRVLADGYHVVASRDPGLTPPPSASD